MVQQSQSERGYRKQEEKPLPLPVFFPLPLQLKLNIMAAFKGEMPIMVLLSVSQSRAKEEWIYLELRSNK